MSLVINLSPTEEAQLSAAATQTGLAPEEWIGKLVREHLPTISPIEETHRRLREWRKVDGTKLMPTKPAAELFAEWAEEDAKMTDAEREENNRIYAEIEMNGIPRTPL